MAQQGNSEVMAKAQLAQRFFALVQHLQRMGMQGFGNMLDSANMGDVQAMNQALATLESQFSRAVK